MASLSASPSEQASPSVQRAYGARPIDARYSLMRSKQRTCASPEPEPVLGPLPLVGPLVGPAAPAPSSSSRGLLSSSHAHRAPTSTKRIHARTFPKLRFSTGSHKLRAPIAALVCCLPRDGTAAQAQPQ